MNTGLAFGALFCCALLLVAGCRAAGKPAAKPASKTGIPGTVTGIARHHLLPFPL